MIAAAPALAAVPLVKLALPEGAQGAEPLASHEGHDHAAMGHAAMIGAEVPAPGGPNDLDKLLYPPPPVPGDVVEYELIATDGDIEVAQGVTFPAWTYNGTVPGPIIRATEGQLLRVRVHERRDAPAHDPLPRDPPLEHGRRLRDRGRRAEPSPTSFRRARPASISTTATPRR